MVRRRRRAFGYICDSRFPPRSVPREAKGGIKSQSKRGAFGESWWARRWIEVLESFNIGARLSRGKSYARRGQVLSIQVEKGRVRAQVQGSRPTPYRTSIQVKTLSPGDWERVVEALSKQAVFSAKLLAGEMPDNIEEAFQGAGVSLFPEKMRDLETDCSCPDWSNPCKHIAAVYYLLGEEFDRDPFLLFRLRGMEREDLMEWIGGHSGVSRGKPDRKAAPPQTEEGRIEASEPLPADLEPFWGRMPEEGRGFGEVSIPQMCAVLPKRLGKFPFWSGEEDFIAAMEQVYHRASQAGLEMFLGKPAFLSERDRTAE